MKSEQVFVFFWSTSMGAHEFFRECQFKSAILEINARPDHLALPLMLSAREHEWEILALFVVVR